jgi:hypothetical protein
MVVRIKQPVPSEIPGNCRPKRRLWLPFVLIVVLIAVLFMIVGLPLLGHYGGPATGQARSCAAACREVEAEVWLWSERYGCLCLSATDWKGEG